MPRQPLIVDGTARPARWRRVRRAITIDCVVDGWIYAVVGGLCAVLGAYALRGTAADATAEFLRRGGWWAVVRATVVLLPLTVGGRIALAAWHAWREPGSSS